MTNGNKGVSTNLNADGHR